MPSNTNVWSTRGRDHVRSNNNVRSNNRSNNNTGMAHRSQARHSSRSRDRGSSGTRRNYSRSRSSHRSASNSHATGNNHNDNNNGGMNARDLELIIESVVRRLGGAGSNPVQRQQQQQEQQQQPEQQQQRQRPNSNPARNNSVRFSAETRQHTYQRDSEHGADWTSSNPDFTKVCKSLFRVVQIQHHLTNWDDLPESLKRNLNHVGENITPPEPNDDLTSDIADILASTGNDIQRHVRNHLRAKLAANRMALSKLDPRDKEEAAEVTYNQLTRRLGKKVPDLRRKVNESAQLIGSARSAAPLLTDIPRTSSWTTPKTPAKRPRLITPSPVQNTNRFQILRNNDEDGNDMEVQIPDTPDTRPEAPSTSSVLPPVQQRSPRPATQRPKKTRHNKEAPAIILRPETKAIIIGDSNLKNIPEDIIPNQWQVEVLPGALISHVIHAVDNLPERPVDIIMSVGINHRDWDFKERTYGELTKFRELVTKRGHNLRTVGIGINPEFDDLTQQNLRDINLRLFAIFKDRYISPLPSEDVFTTNDNIHYTEETAGKLLGSIVNHINRLLPTNNYPNLTTDFPTLAKN